MGKDSAGSFVLKCCHVVLIVGMWMMDDFRYFIIYTVNWQSYLQYTGNLCGNGSSLQRIGILKK